MTVEIEIQLIMEVKKLLKQMYEMSQSEDWSESDAQEVINVGGDLYADYFRNNN